MVEISAVSELKPVAGTIDAVPVETEAGFARSKSRTFEATSSPTPFSPAEVMDNFEVAIEVLLVELKAIEDFDKVMLIDV